MNILKILFIICLTASSSKCLIRNLLSKEQLENFDEDWSREDENLMEKEWIDKNDFKFDETTSNKNSDEEKNDLYEIWNNSNMCNNVHCKSNQICTINQNKIAICVLKKNVTNLKLDKKSNCKSCSGSSSKFFCSSANKTFSSFCHLSYYNCLHSTDDYPVCKGMCPCHTYKKQENKKPSLIKKLFKNQKKNICSSTELEEIGQRLFNWFNVVLKSQSIQNVKFNNLIKRIRFISTQCDEEVNWMFFNLDVNKDLKLSLNELYDLEHDQKEKCLKQFIDSCDTNRDYLLNNNEWCNCFEQFKPCIKKLNQKKLKSKLTNGFLPKCDKNGNYEPLQCNQFDGFCWCVDKDGIEIENTRKHTKVNCGTLNNYVQLDDDTENDGDDDFEDYQNENEGSGD